MSDPSAPNPFPEKRSALRTAVPVEVVLRCADKSGKSFIEKTRTVDISRTGAKTLTEHDVSHGARLQMAVPQRQRKSWATVARIGNKTGNLQEIGVALDDTHDLWGVPMPDEAQPPGAAAAAASQGRPGANGSAAAGEANPSLALAQELMASARLERDVPSVPEVEDETSAQQANVLQEQVRSAIEQYVGDALQLLNEQAAEIMKNLQEMIAQQTEEHLSRCVEEAVRQVQAAAEAAALNVTDRNQPLWEERIRSLTDSAQEQLRARLAEHEASLSTSAAKARRDLARKLADLSSAVGED